MEEYVVKCGESCHEKECDNRLYEASGNLLAYHNGQNYHYQGNGVIGEILHFSLVLFLRIFSVAACHGGGCHLKMCLNVAGMGVSNSIRLRVTGCQKHSI